MGKAQAPQASLAKLELRLDARCRDLRGERLEADLALQVAATQKIKLHQGVYICLAGPSFETPADLRFLRRLGADAVGMSTVPEVTVARHGGTRVLGLAGISNVALVEPGSASPATHDEVLEAGPVIVPKLLALIRGVLQAL